MIEYDWQNNRWIPGYKIINIVWHNYTNFEFQSYTEQHWVNSNWTNYANYYATYTGNNYVGITDTINSGNWVHYERYTYTEDVNGGSVNLNEIYQNSAWVYDTKYSHSYDAHGNYTGYKDESWSSGSWTTTYQYNYIFTYNGNIITERIEQDWNGTIHILVNREKCEYSNFIQLEDGRGIVTNILSNNDIRVYPNPFSAQTTVAFTQEQKNTTIKIIDVLGNEVKAMNFFGKQITIEKGKMKAGIYFMQIIDDNKNVVNRKIIIQ